MKSGNVKAGFDRFVICLTWIQQRRAAGGGGGLVGEGGGEGLAVGVRR